MHPQTQNERQVSEPLRVGFDLDGVLLYNPLRIVRPIAATIKRSLKKDEAHFLIPKSPLVRSLWRLAHRLSFFTPPGFEQIRVLTDTGLIEPYLITARYSFLSRDVDRFVEKHQLAQYFHKIITNKYDEQPHLYKERTIRENNIAIFVEDNWNIVQHLHRTLPYVETLWMYNMLDRSISYPYKFAHLATAIAHITRRALERHHLPHS
jgi:hypothetical protein